MRVRRRRRPCTDLARRRCDPRLGPRAALICAPPTIAAPPSPRGTRASTPRFGISATLGFPFLPPERVIDLMVQAGVSNLPTDLESASRALGGPGKQKDGKKLIKLFCVEGAAPSEHPEEWQRFLSYARQDVEAMREVYRRTRPLPRRGVATVLGLRAHQPTRRRPRPALRAPRCCPGRRGRRRHRPPADRTDRRGGHQGDAGEKDRRLAARSASPTQRCAKC